MGKVIAIVLAAGRGRRMNSDIAKQYLELRGKPVLFYSLSAFQTSKVDEIILVTGKDEITYCKEMIIDKYHLNKVKSCIAGGKERYDSVYQGLLECKDCDYVLIHDGARPFITVTIINHTIDEVKHLKACILGVPAKDTIKIADDNNRVSETPERSRVWQIQTPQVFMYEPLREAYNKMMLQKNVMATDDAMIMEQFGNLHVYILEGSYYNIKITTPEDLKFAEFMLKDIEI